MLCVLDLDGPSRPGHLQRLTGLSSGGVSKMLDRLSEAKLVRRSYGVVPGDNRGVLVTITPQGRRLIRTIATDLGKHLPETKILLKELLAHRRREASTRRGRARPNEYYAARRSCWRAVRPPAAEDQADEDAGHEQEGRPQAHEVARGGQHEGRHADGHSAGQAGAGGRPVGPVRAAPRRTRARLRG